MAPILPKIKPRIAPDGSVMSQAEMDVQDQFQKDQRNGLVNKDGQVTKKYNARGIYAGTGATWDGGPQKWGVTSPNPLLKGAMKK